jgi:hypothetical protein
MTWKYDTDYIRPSAAWLANFRHISDGNLTKQMALDDERHGRPEITQAVTRGAARWLRQRGLAPIIAVPLADGRRADIVAIGDAAEIVIVEVKSSLEDFRVDTKWGDYLSWCDRFYFATPQTFPLELLPAETGVILADAFGAELLRDDSRARETTRLSAARRKALLVRLTRLAGERLQRLADPAFSPLDGA